MSLGLGKGIQEDDARADFARLHEIRNSNNPFLKKRNQEKTPKNKCHGFTNPSKKDHGS
jgi:hypothetical protein